MRGTRDTSRAALQMMIESGAAGMQQARVLLYLRRKHRALTRNEIAEAMGIRLSAICGRVNELLKSRLLTELPRRPCRITGVNAHPVMAA